MDSQRDGRTRMGIQRSTGQKMRDGFLPEPQHQKPPPSPRGRRRRHYHSLLFLLASIACGSQKPPEATRSLLLLPEATRSHLPSAASLPARPPSPSLTGGAAKHKLPPAMGRSGLPSLTCGATRHKLPPAGDGRNRDDRSRIGSLPSTTNGRYGVTGTKIPSSWSTMTS